MKDELIGQKNSVAMSVVVPVYREESNIRPFLERAERTFHAMGISYEIIFCLDPSPDRTEEIILEEIQRNNNIKLIVLSRRFGQPAATMAGIFLCTGDACAVIDVDLQDPPELIDKLYGKLKNGYDMVYAKRRLRKGETLIKKMISKVGYKAVSMLSEVQIPRDTGDFRIMSRRVVEELRRLNETHGFLRGLVAYVGFRQTFIEYDRDKRAHGQGKYGRFSGSLKIGLNGIISFSSKPLQLMSIVGAFVACFSFLLGAWHVFRKLIGIELTPGLPATVLVISFFSGIQLFCMGLMGEYLGRIYDEVKRRPMFIIDRKVNL